VLVATKFLTAKLYSRYVKVVGYFEKVAVGFGHFPPTLQPCSVHSNKAERSHIN